MHLLLRHVPVQAFEQELPQAGVAVKGAAQRPGAGQAILLRAFAQQQRDGDITDAKFGGQGRASVDVHFQHGQYICAERVDGGQHGGERPAGLAPGSGKVEQDDRSRLRQRGAHVVCGGQRQRWRWFHGAPVADN